ncbi:hypothetical protein DPMN_085086 [Dreissena polymorpha]|uniref:Uncharacterized protein n=1 Tax=Dreissena polymorpha TaxID=45954 RepID=A0A9D4BLI9_DREPO|nr:hypothetical protein DPMN_085086 [Dreissena polymorpha]
MAQCIEQLSRGDHEISFEERFMSKYNEDRTYSIILSGEKVRKYYNPSTLCPKIVKLDEKGREVRNRSNILCTEYVTNKHFDKVSKDGNKYRMLQFPVTNWATPMSTYQDFGRADAEQVNVLERFLNFNNTALFMHDGTVDDACRINGFHVHILVQNESDEHLCRNNKWRLTRQKLQKVCDVKTAKIVKHKEFFIHMMTPPRVFMGVNNVEFKNRLLAVYIRDSERALYKSRLPDIQMAAEITLNQEDELRDEPEDREEEGCASGFYDLLGMTTGKRKRTTSEPQKPSAPIRNLYNVDPSEFRNLSTPQASQASSVTINDILRGGTQESRKKPSKSSINIDTAKQLMTKYNRLTSDDLFVAICRSGHEDDIFKIEQLLALP